MQVDIYFFDLSFMKSIIIFDEIILKCIVQVIDKMEVSQT